MPARRTTHIVEPEQPRLDAESERLDPCLVVLVQFSQEQHLQQAIELSLHTSSALTPGKRREVPHLRNLVPLSDLALPFRPRAPYIRPYAICEPWILQYALRNEVSEITPVSQVFKCLRWVFHGEFGDVGAGKSVEI